MNILKRNKTSISVIIITLIVIGNMLYFNVYRFSGYKVSIGGDTITYVKSKKVFNEVYNELQIEMKSKYNKVIIKKDFTLDKVKVVTTEIIDLNNTTVSNKILKEKVTTAVQNKEILIGTYKPIILATTNINSPSRGSISSSFGMRWGKMHKGVDIAAKSGTTINSVLDGTVTYAAWQDGYGKVIKIKHDGSLETTYAHCSAINVKAGEAVRQGEKIGEVGSTGNSTGPHLHFEVRENGEAKNPEKYIK